MRKPWFLILVILILIGAGWLLWINFKKDSGSGPVKKEVIDRIVLKEGSSVISLEHRGEWYLNEEKANLQRVTELLYLSSLIITDNPVSGSPEKGIMKKLESGISAAFYSGQKCIRAFRICRHKNRQYIRFEDQDRAYPIEIEGYPEIDLYQLCRTNRNAWLSEYVLDYLPHEIREVSIRYPEAGIQNFRLLIDQRAGFELYNYRDQRITQEAGVDLMDDYLYGFSGIGYLQRDAIAEPEGRIPDFELLLRTSLEDTVTLRGYSIFRSSDGAPDPNYFEGFSSIHGHVLLSLSNFDPILVS
ncbi:MAG: hypothetical protein JW801_16810 [Bacteroidales bacterium]|nr:hypothetical protein [Bacteroidales bacterium]